jgi:DNA-binding transcriptional LysR family regulator
MSEALIHQNLPFDLPEVHIDMLWHERDGRNPGHQWLRDQVRRSSQQTMANSI